MAEKQTLETSKYYIAKTGQWRCLDYPDQECRQDYCGYCGPAQLCVPTGEFPIGGSNEVPSIASFVT